MTFVRSSKFRHVYGNAYKPDLCFTDLKADGGGDANCAVSCRFFASINGQKTYVIPLDKPGRQSDADYLDHKSKALDLQFSPFNDHVLASGHENGDVNVWEIPEGGLNKKISEPFWDLSNVHTKKVSFVCWHPVAENVLATGGFDNYISIWDCENQVVKYTIDVGDAPTNMAWNEDGSLMAITTRGKSGIALMIVDPRTQEIKSKNPCCYDGTKPAKCVFLNNGNVITVGSTRQAHRSISMWDKDDVNIQLADMDAGSSSAVLNVMYDGDLNILYTYGKGESVIKYYEFDDKNIYHLSDYTSAVSQKGGNFLPKRGVDYKSNEIARFYKLQPSKCEPISIICPRKSEHFQEDIFPNCFNGQPGLTADEWFEGKNNLPPKSDIREFEGVAVPKTSSAAPKRTPSAKPLVKKLAVKRDVADQNANGACDGVDIAALVDDVKKLKSTVKKLSKRVTDLEARSTEAAGDHENGGEEEEEEEE